MAGRAFLAAGVPMVMRDLKPGPQIPQNDRSMSGNVDFCLPSYTDLVTYKMIPIKEDQYPYGAGRSWADPSVTDVARKMRAFVESPVPKLSKTIWPEFSPDVAGARYKTRLPEILEEQR